MLRCKRAVQVAEEKMRLVIREKRAINPVSTQPETTITLRHNQSTMPNKTECDVSRS